MRSVYIAATEGSAGKTTVALGLCLAMRDRGLDAGYFKPVGGLDEGWPGVADEDAGFVAGVLDLHEDPVDLCPLCVSESAVMLRGDGPATAPLDTARVAFDRASAGHDLLVCEGFGEIWQGRFLEVSGADMAAALDLPVLLVARFAGSRQLDDIYYVKDILRDRLLGVLFTMVPETRLNTVETDYAGFLERQGVAVYGVMPASRRLAAVPVGAIAAELGGELIAGAAAADALAETYLIGAMGPEHALSYFERTPNKVVVVGADREKLIRAALKTSTVAVVLTGTARPSPAVVERAEKQDVALIAVPHDTASAAERLRHLFGSIRVHEQSKIDLIEQLMASCVEVEPLLDDLS